MKVESLRTFSERVVDFALDKFYAIRTGNFGTEQDRDLILQTLGEAKERVLIGGEVDSSLLTSVLNGIVPQGVEVKLASSAGQEVKHRFMVIDNKIVYFDKNGDYVLCNKPTGFFLRDTIKRFEQYQGAASNL